MNSESPFRISSTVLTVACILSGLTAAPYLMSQLTPHPNVVDQITVAANALQVNLAEFQTNGGHSVAQIPLQGVTSRAPHFNTPAKASESATLLRIPTVAEQTGSKNKVMTARREFIQTTSVERSVSPSESDGHSVPHFYAPVTVHPVTVNIDNAGIIREISRVHQRLDSLCAEAKSNAQSEAP